MKKYPTQKILTNLFSLLIFATTFGYSDIIHQKYDMTKDCGETVHRTEGAELIYKPFEGRKACRVRLRTAGFDQHFLVRFKDYDIKDCNTRLRIFAENDPTEAIDMTCESPMPKPTIFKSNNLVAELTGGSTKGPGRGFDILVTPMAKRAVCDGFKCVSDGYCINGKLKCDGVQHCVDGSDERTCDARSTKKAFRIGAGIIAAIVIGILLCLALTIGACIWFMRRRRERV